MTKELKALEILDKLEECAYAMKDLPMSNWIDLAENEAELDLKIMDWVETIKIELLKGKQSLLELKQIKEAEPSEALKCVGVLKEDDCITTLVQGKALETIRQYILKAQEQEKLLKVILKKRIDLESFYSTFVKDDLDYKYYEKHYGTYGLEKITQQEFNTLKEVFCNDK